MKDVVIIAVVLFGMCVFTARADAQLQGGNIQDQEAFGTENLLIQRDTGAFVGGATGFVGAGAQGNTLGALGGLNTGGLGGLGGLRGGLGGGLGGFGRGGQFGQTQFGQQNTAATRPIRVSIRLGFTHPGPAPTVVSAKFARRLRRLPSLPSAESVAVEMDGRTAVLRGEVASGRERDLIARLALLEPGVSDVKNELTVKSEVESIPPPAVEESTN